MQLHKKVTERVFFKISCTNRCEKGVEYSTIYRGAPRPMHISQKSTIVDWTKPLPWGLPLLPKLLNRERDNASSPAAGTRHDRSTDRPTQTIKHHQQPA